MNNFVLSQPTICIVSGIAGSGKTALGSEISRRLANGVLLSKDLIQDAFTNSQRSGELYGLISGPTFRVLVSFCDVQLSHGKIPIIDAPFTFNHQRNDEYKDWVSHFKNVAGKHGARLAIIRCLPPSEKVLRERIEQRGYARDEWNLKNWEAFLKRDPIDFPIEHDDVLELVTDRDVSESVDVIIDYLSEEKNGIKLLSFPENCIKR